MNSTKLAFNVQNRRDNEERETSICFPLMTTKFRSLLGFTSLRRPRLVHEQKIMICEKFRHSLQVRGGMTRAMVTSHKSCPTQSATLSLPFDTPRKYSIIGYRHYVLQSISNCPVFVLYTVFICFYMSITS